MRQRLAAGPALLGVVGLLAAAWPCGAAAQTAPLVTAQPDPGADITPYFIDPATDPVLPPDQMIALLRAKLKYVFVIFHENHSFDNEYGTFPGVNGIYSDGAKPRSAAATPGFTQTYQDVNGALVTVEPFRLGPQQNSSFRDSVDHGHAHLAAKLNVRDGTPRMDRFAQQEYLDYARLGNNMSQAQGTQFARLVMSHIDCDTIPFFWRYASRFTIFDDIFATEDTPSTPNAIAMIAGQSGETQWVEHGTAGTTGPIGGTINGTAYTGMATTQGLPVVSDWQPWWGSAFDATTANRQPTGPKEYWAPGNTASNLTFATVPLTMMGRDVTGTVAKDADGARDLRDIQRDIPFIQSWNSAPVSWRWYQNGYDLEPTDSGGVASHLSFVSHHEGPQYFGYLANNSLLRRNFGGENDFFTDLANKDLPADGGVFYIRGGYYNLSYPRQTPPIQNPRYPSPAGLTASEIATINAAKSGDDDHPNYSDSQLSEAMTARVINAIARDPAIWSQGAIIITYDESDGFYDHVPPRILSYGPDGLPLSRGIRVPLLVISPYARVHAVSHAEGDHNAVIETINAIFGLPALSSLPDEAAALAAGNMPEFNKFGPPGFEQKYLGPRDTNSPITESLLSGFDPQRLRDAAPALPAAYATIPDDVVDRLPHYGGNGCQAIGIRPEDQRQGIVNNIPANFNALPATLPAYN